MEVACEASSSDSSLEVLFCEEVSSRSAVPDERSADVSRLAALSVFSVPSEPVMSGVSEELAVSVEEAAAGVVFVISLLLSVPASAYQRLASCNAKRAERMSTESHGSSIYTRDNRLHCSVIKKMFD